MTRTEAFVARLFDARWPLVGLLLALTVLFAAFAGRVGVENRLEVWFLDDDPALASYRDFQEAFGGEETVIVALHRDGGLLDADGQRLLAQATRELQALPGVLEVRSLANWPVARMTLAGPAVSPLFGEDAPSAAEAEALRERILGEPGRYKGLVSGDGASAVLQVRLRALEDLDARRPAILQAIDARLEDLSVPHHLAGSGVIYSALNQAATVDSAALLALAHVLMALLLVGVFRRLWPAVATLGAVMAAVAWTVGLMGLFGRDINIVTMVVPTLVLVIGVADCIHILQHVAAQPPSDGRRERVARGVAAVFWPCLWNTLTSAAAFAVLWLSPMPVVRDLGLFCAAGVVFAFVASVGVCVFALAYPRAEPRPTRDGLLQRLAAGLATAAERHPRRVLGGAAVLALVMGAGALRLQADTHSIGYLPESHRVQRDSAWIERHLGPYLPLEFVVRAERGWKDPALLRELSRWQRAAEGAGAAGSTGSVIDALEQGAELFTGKRGLPEDDAALGRLAALYEEHAPGELAAWVKGDVVRVTFAIPMQSARGIAGSIEAMEALARMPPGARLEASGYLPLYVRMMGHMVRSQLESFTGAFLLVFLLMGLLLRSGRLTLLAIPANLLPILIVLGLMGWTGIPLDAATVTLAALILGLVVDDSIHLLYRLRKEEAHAREGAVARTVRGVGPSLLSTSLVLTLGFGVLGFAQVSSVAWFGMLLAVAMPAALLADLLVTPALVAALAARAIEEPLEAAPAGASS